MTLADKIAQLRKKNGWSQEQLAEKMEVSRQAVSKWESAQTIPDVEKLLQLSKLFGVTTDYLLKEDREEEQSTENSGFRAGSDLSLLPTESEGTVKRLSLEESMHYIAHRKWASHRIALATFLCILSPITLILLSAASELIGSGITETTASVIGLGVMFLFLLCAIPIYVYCGFKNAPFEFLDKNVPFELSHDAQKAVSEKQAAFRNTYVRGNTAAACICIFSPLPLLFSAFTENDFLSVIMLAVLLLIAGTGVFLFIAVGVQNASIKKLLKEGAYTPHEKKKSRIRESIGFIYWGVLTAVYFAWSYLSNDWHVTWLVFAVGGILFPALMAICGIIFDKSDKP